VFDLEIKSALENYKVLIDVDFKDETSKYDFLIVDEFFKDEFLGINTPVFWVKCEEQYKTLSQVEAICEAMKSASVRRNSSIAAVGGGLVQDLATLAASIYMRGIKWSYFPTTLTGMADSCLGGKSSINVGGTKNLVGNVYPPAAIYIDLYFASTLSIEAKIAGLAEAVKICFARGSDEFEEYLSNSASVVAEKDGDLGALISLSLSSKKWFIERDEFDVAERQLLNFGHSFGHALEAACGFSIQHGVGVAIGMLAAISHPSSHQSHSAESLEQYILELLSPLSLDIAKLGKDLNWEIFERSIASDKKNTGSHLCLILPGSSGELEKMMLPYSEDSIKVASGALQHALSLFNKSGEN
jgi:3-dehydroquinate synthase